MDQQDNVLAAKNNQNTLSLFPIKEAAAAVDKVEDANGSRSAQREHRRPSTVSQSEKHLPKVSLIGERVIHHDGNHE